MPVALLAIACVHFCCCYLKVQQLLVSQHCQGFTVDGFAHLSAGIPGSLVGQLAKLANFTLSLAGSPFRDEITLGVLQLQENNRLEILKRRWWEGGKCLKEEDHRAKGE